MPLFFIHHRTRDSYEPGDIGCPFDTLDLAYLDAYCAAVEMSAELLLAHADPSHHVFEIADERGLVLIDIPFAEVLRHRRPPKIDDPASIVRGSRPAARRTARRARPPASVHRCRWRRPARSAERSRHPSAPA